MNPVFFTRSAALVAVMALTTWLLRFAPFRIFRKKTPEHIIYLGKVLPPALIGMLAVYCLRNLNPTAFPFGLPELASAACVALLQCRTRNSIASVLGGTAVYMLLIRILS